MNGTPRDRGPAPDGVAPWFHSVTISQACGPGGPASRLLPPMTIGRTAMRAFGEQIARATAHIPPPKTRR
ncbi:hypothetical protein GCM10027258_62480 [Amycolatopsis stemonae]